MIVSLKREVNILQQENNHLRKLLELADSDSGISLPQENSAMVMAQLGMDRSGSGLPLDGRGENREVVFFFFFRLFQKVLHDVKVQR